MPRVPRRQQNALGTDALPGVRVGTNAPTPQPAPGRLSVEEGVDLSGFRKEVAEVIQRERQKGDQIALTEADAKASALETSLLHDKDTGVLNRRGKNVLGAPDEMADAWEKGASEIEAELTTDLQKAAFRRVAGQRWASINNAVQRHVAEETRRYDDETTQAHISNETTAATANYRDPSRVDLAAMRIKAAVADHAQRNGLAPERREELTVGALSRLHVSVIGQFITSGDDRTALAYFQKVKTEVAGEHLERIEGVLETASTEGTALRAAGDVWTAMGPKSENDPVRIADMEEKLRERYADDPKVYKAARQELRSRAEGFNAQQRELTAHRKATVLGAFAGGASVSSLVRSVEYLALGGAEQEQLKSYFISQQRAAESHALTTEAREETARERRGLASYLALTDPDKLRGMSDNMLLAMEPIIGRQRMVQLMEKKRTLEKSETAVREAKIDADAFNTIANEAGLDPFRSKPDEAHKAMLGGVRFMVEAEIDREQRIKGRALTHDEKTALMRTIVDRKVMRDESWGRDTEVSAVAVKPDERGNVYVPIEKVPSNVVAMSLQFLRSSGSARANENDTLLRARLQRRIERAYAAYLAGADAEEQRRILKGAER